MEMLVKARTSRWYENHLNTLSSDLERQVMELITGDEDFFLPRLFTPNPEGKISHRDIGYPLAVLTEIYAKNDEVLVENELGDSIVFRVLPLETQLAIFKTIEQLVTHRQYLDENSN